MGVGHFMGESREGAAQVFSLGAVVDVVLDRIVPFAVKALELDPRQPRWHFSLGALQVAKGNHPAALISYEKALELNPKYAAAANNLAWVLAETGGDLSRAQSLATRAQRLAPNNSDILDTLGWIHLKSRSYGAAVRFFEDGINITPERPLLHYHLGLAHMGRDDQAAARQSLQKSLSLDPNHANADSAQFYLAQLNTP